VVYRFSLLLLLPPHAGALPGIAAFAFALGADSPSRLVNDRRRRRGDSVPFSGASGTVARNRLGGVNLSSLSGWHFLFSASRRRFSCLCLSLYTVVTAVRACPSCLYSACLRLTLLPGATAIVYLPSAAARDADSAIPALRLSIHAVSTGGGQTARRRGGAERVRTAGEGMAAYALAARCGRTIACAKAGVARDWNSGEERGMKRFVVCTATPHFA